MFTRRLSVFGIALLLLVTACSPVATPSATPAPTATVAQSGPSSLSVAVASNDFPIGETRVPFVLFSGANPIADAQSVSVIAFDLSSGTPVPGWQGVAQSYSDYAIPYWVVYPNLPAAGFWGLGVVVTLADGAEQQASFTVETSADPSAPVIGEAAPASHNRTTATASDLAQLTSDTDPEPAFYTTTVADAIASGQPTVVTIATPGFCTSRLCAPVVNSVKAVYADHPTGVNYIHIEVYSDFQSLTYAPEMDEWHLPSEPWTFVLDAQGRVVGRFGGPVSPTELEAVLVPLLS